jgi:hypothetical protein
MQRTEIKKVLREALGVPHNIVEVSKNAYQRILNWVKRLDSKDFEYGQGVSMNFRVDYQIADFRFTTLKVKLGVDEHPKIKTPEIMSMAIRSQSRKTEDMRLEPIKNKTVDLVIVMLVPTDFNYEELPVYFEKNKNEIIENLSHEFKHAYDHFKKLYDNPIQRAEYQSSINLGFNFEPLDIFVHDIYFSSANENLVRPSEISAAIQTGQISQKDFLEFLRSNDTYKNLKRIKDFNIQDFENRILKDEKGLNKLLRKVGEKPKLMTPEEKLESIYKLLYSVISQKKIISFAEMIKTNFLEELLGFQDEKKKVFDKFVSRVSRFENPKDFVKYYEKFFNYIGDKMIRKISKLYAITQKK